MIANATSAAPRRPVLTTQAIYSRWLFWTTFWYYLAIGLYFVVGVCIIYGGSLLIQNRQSVQLGFLQLYRRCFGKAAGPLARKIFLGVPLVIGIVLIPGGLCWSIFGPRNRPNLWDGIFGILGLAALVFLQIVYSRKNRRAVWVAPRLS
jgi:hypothetical protein